VVLLASLLDLNAIKELKILAQSFEICTAKHLRSGSVEKFDSKKYLSFSFRMVYLLLYKERFFNDLKVNRQQRHTLCLLRTN
jgi:hypothetical protein